MDALAAQGDVGGARGVVFKQVHIMYPAKNNTRPKFLFCTLIVIFQA